MPVWSPIPELSQTYQAPVSPRRRMPVSAALVSLDNVLPRIADKMIARCHNPRQELQHRKLRPANGIRSPEDLAAALVRFHITLSPAELDLLFRSFPSAHDAGLFDMVALADALFRRGEEQAFGRDDTAEKKLRPPQRGMKRATEIQAAAAEQNNASAQWGSTNMPAATAGRTMMGMEHKQAAEAQTQTHELALAGSATAAAAAPVAGAKSGLAGKRRDVSGRGVAAALTGWGGASTQRALGAPRPSIESLHTPRGTSLLAKAGSNSLQQQQSGKGGQTARASGGQTHNGSATSRAGGANTARVRMTPRLDFVSLSQIDPQRFERSAASLAADRLRQQQQPFVHTAR